MKLLWLKSWIYKTKIFEFIFVYGGTVLILIKHKGDCNAAMADIEAKAKRQKMIIKHMENKIKQEN